MELHAEVTQFHYEVWAKDELAVCVGRDSHFVSPLLGLVINSEKINGFVHLPPGTTEYDWVIWLVIVFVGPDLRRVKERLALQAVVTVHAASDQDLLVAGKCDGALAAAP